MSRSKLFWIVIILVALAGIWAVPSMFIPAGGDEPTTIQIPRGSSAGSVGRILRVQGVIRSAFGFRVLARVSGKSTDLKPGAYRVSGSMSPVTILDMISRGDVCARWVTFPEGFTIRQIAERLEEKNMARADRFMQMAQSSGIAFSTDFPHPADSLEGYLFPDTYLLPTEGGEEAIIQEMLACFERKVAEPLADEIHASGMTLHGVVTLASLIEREARIPRDRLLISAVLHNRLKKNMRLECDATVLYALGEHKDRVLYSDLEHDSPYNTYLHPGLPPGPIANPGLASIEAALRPADVDYLYYVARSDGSHIFSRTFEEHQRARGIAKRKDSR